jgi:hypothetical protein
MRDEVEFIRHGDLECSMVVSFFWKIFTLPVAWLYFRRRFGRDFFRKPSMCWDCNEAPVNGSCPGCGWLMARSSWGRYMGPADMGMLEFASYEAKDYAKAKQAKELAKTFNQSTPVDVEHRTPPVDLTSNLFDD